MKKLIILLSVLLCSCASVFATKHTISTVGTSFSPATVTAHVGDTIEFVLVSIHTATQVEQSTWNSGGNTPKSGGFNFSAGTNNLYVVKASDTGTIYFVCQPHASIGMKGSIEVQTVGINGIYNQVSNLRVFPNPVMDGVLTIETSLRTSQVIQIYDLSGKQAAVYSVAGEKPTIDISQLPAGVYFVKIGNAVSRVVKQ